LLDSIEIDLRGTDNTVLTVYIDVADNSLSRKWLAALNDIIRTGLHLEKNYCWLGWTEGARTAEFLCTQINRSINAINSSSLDYRIQDFFSPANVIQADLEIDHARMNQLHRYFEDLQGTAGAMSPHYTAADDHTRWHIRQLNLLCHELESLVLSLHKLAQAPEWRRPSQLMCWLQAPRFELEAQDLELFGIETINRKLGGVYVGVNKAVGKHHWEVFQDEGRDSRVAELHTTGLRTQTQAAGDFDIEWARDPGAYHWQIQQLAEFREWLARNGFDPDDASLTIGHPQIGQVDLFRSFGTRSHDQIWAQLSTQLDVYQIRTSSAQATYDYHWSDADYDLQQIKVLDARHNSQ
jgi:hypothetical protein